MKGDLTRNTFRPKRHYTGVRMQQGRVQLDADWNEQADIASSLHRQAMRDLIGPAGAPQAAPGFAITIEAGRLRIGGGRFYLDGMQLDCEPASSHGFSLEDQPFLPGAGLDQGKGAGCYQVYLEAWERHVTALEDLRLREIALGGPDTATRIQAAWQVKIRYTGPAANPLACSDLPAGFGAASGRLEARAMPPAAAEEDCLLPPQGGYAGLENHLYRVEIHIGGDESQAKFKWSRENGSVVTSWGGTSGSTIAIGSSGKDDALRFEVGRWVELSSEGHELVLPAGTLAKIQVVNEDSLVIDSPIEPGSSTDPADFPGVRTARRWEGLGEVKDFLTFGELEDGLQIRFEKGNFQAGDYWIIPARARIGADSGTIEWPPDPGDPALQPPAGVRRSFTVLAVGNYDGTNWIQVKDCRTLIPPLTGLVAGTNENPPARNESCCTVQVGDGKLSLGEFNDLQAAIDYARSLQRPVTVCLLPGLYELRQPVAAYAASADAPLTLSGCGAASLLHFLPLVPVFIGSVTHIETGKSVSVNLENAPSGKNFDVLIRSAGSAAWQRAGSMDSGEGGHLSLALMLPPNLASAPKMEMRLQDQATRRPILEIPIDAPARPAPAWPVTPIPAGAPPLLMIGSFTRLENLFVESDVTGIPAVALLGRASAIWRCSLQANAAQPGTYALAVLQSAGVSVTESRFSLGDAPGTQPLAVGLRGNDLVFEGNTLAGGVHLAPGSRNVEISRNVITSFVQPDQVAQEQSGILLGRPFASNVIKNVLELFLRSMGDQGRLNSESEWMAVNGLAVITGARIQENQVSAALIGIATYVDNNPEAMAAPRLANISITGNTIQRCGQPADAQQTPAFGAGIFLEQASWVQILENEILQNGGRGGGWGIYLSHCLAVEISRNHIIGNGMAPPGNPWKYLQAGIFLVDVRELSSSNSSIHTLVGRSASSSPAVILRDNLVVMAGGPTLFLLGRGDASITGNILNSAEYIPQGPIRPDFLGADPLNLAPIFNSASLAGVLILIISEEGRCQFSTNQLTQSMSGLPPEKVTTVHRLISAGQASVADNQFKLSLPPRSSLDSHVLINGSMLQVSGNSFVEPGASVHYSCKSDGAINSTINNQAVNCIKVSQSPANPSLLADHDNISLIPC